MKEKFGNRIILILDWIVFVGGVLTVSLLCYEAITKIPHQQALGLALAVLDNGFVISVIALFIFREKQTSHFIINCVNAVVIVVAYSMYFAGIDFPAWSLLVWDVALPIYYGYRCMRHLTPGAK